MKASRIAIFTGMLLAIVFLAVQNARLRSMIEGVESQSSGDFSDASNSLGKTTPSFSSSSTLDRSGEPVSRSVPQVFPPPGNKVAQRIAKDRSAEQDKQAQVDSDEQRAISGVTGSLSLSFQSVVKEKIEHWTGGDKRRWGHEQAAGSPDTTAAGDIPSAWASKDPDGGEEWIKLDYDRFVALDKVSVVESHNPGAISKVVAVLSDGNEAVIWEGHMDASEQDELVASDFQVTDDLRARSVKVYLDTARVPGWNEIDAVQITGKDGSKQWASASSSSSSYADP